VDGSASNSGDGRTQIRKAVSKVGTKGQVDSGGLHWTVVRC
jgi:hypothetical protein